MSLNGSPKWMYNAGGSFYNGVISQSLRVQNSHHLERTPSTGTDNQSTWTFSAWIKRGKLGSVQHICYRGGDGSNQEDIRFFANDKLNIYDSGAAADSDLTARVFRETTVMVSHRGSKTSPINKHC